MSSVRWYISLQARPVIFETCAATCTGSQNSRRPNEPPEGTTCTVTLSAGRPRSIAIACLVMIGVCRPAQISARSARTSAIAHSTSSGQCVAAANWNSPSTVTEPSGGSANGRIAAFSVAWIEASDCPASGPLPQVMSSAAAAA